MLSFHPLSIGLIGSANAESRAGRRWDSGGWSVPTPAASPWEGRKEGRKAGGSQVHHVTAAGEKLSRRASPKNHPMKSKAMKTKVTCRNKTGGLLFLFFASPQRRRERTEPSPALPQGSRWARERVLLSPLSKHSDPVRFNKG